MKENKRKNILIILLSMLAAAIVFVIFTAVQGVSPFGENNLMRNDASAQYVPLLYEFVNRLKSGDSLFYSFTSGGTNFFATICYYLINPVNLLAFLFSNENIEKAFTLIIAIHTVLSSGTFSYYLIKKYNRADLSISVFSLLYTFCGFYMAYYYNTMWMSAFVMLPLVALGIEKIVAGKTGWFYFFTLAITIFCCFYTGYIVCLFSVLYFFILLFSNPHTQKTVDGSHLSKEDIGEAPIGKVIINYGVFSLFAGLVCAVVLIPIYCALQYTAAKHVFTDNSLFFNIFDFMGAQLDNVGIPSLFATKDELPAVACGMLTFCLLPLYFFNKKFPINEKIASAVMLLFLLLSFQIPQLNMFWHGFAEPTKLPYRFAFIFCFLAVALAYRAFANIKKTPLWAFAIPVVLTVAAAIYATKSDYIGFSTKTVIVSAIFGVAFIIILLLLKYDKLKLKIVAPVLMAAVMAETCIGQYSNFLNRESSLEELNPAANGVAIAKQEIENTDKDLFYRTETDGSGVNNQFFSDILYGGNGVSSFSSLNDYNYAVFQFNMGLRGNINNAYSYTTQTAFYNALFNVKYVYSSESKVPQNSPYYSKSEADNLSKNNYCLPLGYVCDNGVVDWEIAGPTFSNQNTFWKAVTGNEFPFKTIDSAEVIGDKCNLVSLDDVRNYMADNAPSAEEHEHEGETDHHDSSPAEIMDTAIMVGGLYPYKAVADNYSLTVKITAENDGEMYFVQETNIFHKMDVILEDGSKLTFNVGTSNTLPRSFVDAGYVHKGSSITVKFYDPSKTVDKLDSSLPLSDTVYIQAATMDDEIFKAGYNQIIENGTLDLTKFEEDKIEGTVKATKDGVMMMSMPYDKGWQVLVDGVATELTENQSHIMMFNITKGEHTIQMKYVPTGLKEGAFVSAASVVALLLIALLMNVRKKKEELFPEENPDAEFVNSNKNDDTERGEDSKE